MQGREERGAISVLAVVIVGVILALSVALLDVTAVLSARTRAQTAADAAALAAAPATFTMTPAPREAARRMAEANGADLVWCRCRVDRRHVPRSVAVRTQILARLWFGDEVRVFAQARAEYVPYPVDQ